MIRGRVKRSLIVARGLLEIIVSDFIFDFVSKFLKLYVFSYFVLISTYFVHGFSQIVLNFSDFVQDFLNCPEDIC